jgi:hypothetical protein
MSEKSGPAGRLQVRRHHVPLLIFLLVAGLLSLLLRGFLRQVVFIPLLELAFTLYLTYHSLPQNVLWAVFLALAIAVALRSLPLGRPRREETAPPSPARGRVATLAELAAAVGDSDYARWQLAGVVEALALEMLQQRSGAPVAVVRRRITAGEVDLPPPLRALFEARRALPTYRHFIAARNAAARGRVDCIAALDLEGALDAVERGLDVHAEFL